MDRDHQSRIERRLGLYIHWPFCRSKCPYCDFNSHVLKSFEEQDWVRGIQQQLTHTFYWLEDSRKIQTIFFGGGTPSLLSPQAVGDILNHVHTLWGVSHDCEISMEANPTSVEAAHLPGYRAAGVNRLSIGVQALNDKDLRFLGRGHSSTEAKEVIALAAKTFSNFSFDLIYARPQQTLADWRDELEDALSFNPPHLSVYQLTIEPGTAFAVAYPRGDFDLPGEEAAADLYEMTQGALEEAGLPAYEVSNHAQPGFACQHNMIYWQSDDYIGVGPGAHGRFLRHDGQRLATRQFKVPEKWLKHIVAGELTPEETIVLMPETCHNEFFLMGLRLKTGFSEATYRSLTGWSFTDKIPPAKWQGLINEGLLEQTPVGYKPTSSGLQKVNALWRFLSIKDDNS